MALVKMKPTSPGRRGMVKVVNTDLYKGVRSQPWLKRNRRPPAVTTTAISPPATSAVVTSSTTA